MTYFTILTILMQAVADSNAPNWNILIPSFFGLVTTCFMGYLAYKANQAGKTLQTVKEQSDGQNTEMVKISKALGVAEGKEIATEKAEAKAADLVIENAAENENPLKVELVKPSKPNGE